jgi:hypothetical protein
VNASTLHCNILILVVCRKILLTSKDAWRRLSRTPRMPTSSSLFTKWTLSQKNHVIRCVHPKCISIERHLNYFCQVFEQRSLIIKDHCGSLNCTCFRTSIWDETLYKAWSSIVYSLIPNIKELESHLKEFCEICESDEVVLFERATFLVISHATRTEHRDMHRFEKISNIIKQFKLSCRCACFVSTAGQQHSHQCVYAAKRKLSFRQWRSRTQTSPLSSIISRPTPTSW